MALVIPAPPFCFECVIPKVRDENCEYCHRYGRACGRHEPHPAHDKEVTE